MDFRNEISHRKNKKLFFRGIGAINSAHFKSLKEIERKLSVPHHIGKRYYHCIQNFGYKNILEIGTCIGIGTIYLAKANPEAHIYTLEGNEDCIAQAKTNFEALNIQNIAIEEGLFEDTLKATLEKMKHVDMAVMDGNHQYESTITYFNLLLPYIHEDSLIVIDDIHWSKGMNKAWLEIINHKQVSLSLDFYRNGFVFFKKNRLEKEKFKIWVND